MPETWYKGILGMSETTDYDISKKGGNYTYFFSALEQMI